MSLLDEIKNQMVDNENKSDESLPWEEPSLVKNTNNNKSLKSKLNTNKKLLVLGIIIIFIVLIIICTTRLLGSGETIQVENENQANTTQANTQIQVHIAGEVKKPGVYKMESGSRIIDGINAAGGFTEKANQASLNLAKTLDDGEQIVVESIEKSTSTSNTQNPDNGTNNGKININTADATQLQSLSGVGPSTAQKIIDYRNANGKFKTIEDIKKVSGIGEKTFAKFADKICV